MKTMFAVVIAIALAAQNTTGALKIIVIEGEGAVNVVQQKTFTRDDKKGKLRVIASPDGRDGSVTIHAVAVVYAGIFDAGDSAEISPKNAWVHVARGKVRVNGKELEDGDGAAIEGEASVKLEGTSGGEVLVFDLP